MARLYVQAQKFQISGSGISSSATSLNLVSFKITKPDASTRDITMADFGDLGLMVLEPGVARKEETISFTGVTQNGDGSATLTGVTRGITPFSPYGADASYASAHSGFVTAILSNPAKMYSNFIGPTDDVTVTGLWNFPYPTTSTHAATKQYVDDVLAGAIGTATDTTAGSTRLTKNQGTKPRAQSTYVREQDTPNMTLKVESFRFAFIDSVINFAGGNSPAFINPGFGGDLGIVANPSNTETVTLTINGTVCTFTFVSSIGAAPGNILIQGTAALTRAALATFIANPGTTNANQVAFAGAQLTALGLISSTDDLSASLFIRATSATVTTFTGAETMAGGSNTWTANTTKNRLDLLVLNGGSLVVRRGSEAVSPVLPTPTSGDIVLASVYNIPGETVIRDRTAALSGYIEQWYDLSIYRTDLPTTDIAGAFGTGVDGDVVISSNTSLTRDMYYNNLTVNSTFILNPNGFRIFVRGILTLNGSIAMTGGNGGAGSGVTAGSAGTAAATGGSIYGGIAGLIGGAGGPANTGGTAAGTSATTNVIGTLAGVASGAGGNGGNGAGGGAGGGAGATPTSTIAGMLPYTTPFALSLHTMLDTVVGFMKTAPQAAGGGGGGCGSNNGGGGNGGVGGGGGGGGASGGLIAVFAKTIIISSTGTITSRGGNGGAGANGTNAAGAPNLGGGGGGGGGAGGHGGVIVLVYTSLTNAGTISCPGGTGGAFGAGGTPVGGTAGAPGIAGAAGSAGVIYQIDL
jgi:hypothetical protein